MGDNSHIQWTDATWNPLTGCSKVSDGCKNCYAIRDAHRLAGNPNEKVRAKYFDTTTKDGRNWTGVVRLVEEVLDQPLRWKRPRRIFVNSMSDLFHESVPDEWIDKIFAVMALAPQHSFQILTKRPKRMLEYFKLLSPEGSIEAAVDRLENAAHAMGYSDEAQCQISNAIYDELSEGHNTGWPMRNVYLGVSVEDQKTADERIPLLLQTPAAVRWLSAEPLLEKIMIPNAALSGMCETVGSNDYCGAMCKCANGPWKYNGKAYPAIDWVVVGGESGPGARAFNIDWARSIVHQCQTANVPVFVKQLGARVVGDPGEFMTTGNTWESSSTDDSGPILQSRKGSDITEWPRDLRVREFPNV